jgi:antitoxin (DNA-binding transcriptional repressor) of toxin-antitoxin stability system
MQILSIREVRGALGHLDELFDTTDEIIITKHGEAIARILPMKGKHSRPTHEELHCLTKKLSTPSEKVLRKERDER